MIYAGGFCGLFILFLIPLTLVVFTRRAEVEKRLGPNFNKSYFSNKKWLYFIVFYAVLTLAAVISSFFGNHAGKEKGDPCEGAVYGDQL